MSIEGRIDTEMSISEGLLMASQGKKVVMVFDHHEWAFVEAVSMLPTVSESWKAKRIQRKIDFPKGGMIMFITERQIGPHTGGARFDATNSNHPMLVPCLLDGAFQ